MRVDIEQRQTQQAGPNARPSMTLSPRRPTGSRSARRPRRCIRSASAESPTRSN
jgi:hypothetical protein